MAIIYSYPLNDDIKPLDELVGTTQQTINGQLKTVTRNFLLANIAEFLIIDGGIQKTLTLTTNGTSGVSTLDQATGILNIPHYPGDLKIALLFKETFEYTGSNLFPLINTINNVLQVIVNTTSLHPVAYSVELPNIVNVLNELYSGDTITIIYNYLEEVVETPNLQSVTDEGNHTTNNIIIDNIPGEYGSYTVTNTLNDLGTFQSYTSPTSSPDYQTTYAGYEMSISEIYSPTENLEMYIGQGIMQTSYSDGSDNTAARLYSGNSVNGASLYIEKNDVNGQLKIDDLTDNITLQFPDKPTGTYTIATTSDVIPFNPAEYDLDEFTNTNIDPFAKISDIPVLGYTPVNKAGDTMLGDLILNQDPSNALGAATKQYVDNIASGINFHEPVHAATTLNLVADYDNGISGVGATLTATSYGALVVDTHTVTSLQRVLVWQQTDPTENGIYDLTVVGDGGTYWELTRSSDADNSPPGEIMYGDFTFVQQGATYGGFGFICNTAGTITIGVTPINYVQFNAAQVVTAGYGLQELSPNVISIDPLVTQEKITLTTTGSGAATLVSNTLNIPTLPQATTSVSGYLSSTDWNTFNGKANVNSQLFTGTPSLPTGTIGVTQTAGTNNTTLATTAFATTALNGKMNNPSLTASYIPKALTTTTIGDSRLLDTGTYLGIGTVSTPTKDITLGNQGNKVLGIEQSSNTIDGRTLLIEAGRAINFVPDVGFVRTFSNIGTDYLTGITVGIDNTVYVANYSNGNVYRQINGSGAFSYYASTGINRRMATAPNGDIYGCSNSNGASTIYRKPLGSDIFSPITITSRSYEGITITASGDIYVSPGEGDIYKQTNSTGSFVSQGVPGLIFKYLTTAPNGDVWGSAENVSGIYKQTGGTGAFNFFSNGSGAMWVLDNGDVYLIGYLGIIYVSTAGTAPFISSGLTNPNGAFGGAAKHPNGSISLLATFTDIYFQNNDALGTANLQGGTLKLYSGTGKGTGASDIELYTGQVLASGTDMQTSTLRAKINNTGLMTLPSVTNALIESDTTGKAVVTKEYVNNRLVVETTSGYTLTNADSGGIVVFTASATLIIPTGLPSGFECSFVTLSGVTLTVVSTGNTLNNATSTTMLPQLSFTLKRMLAANTYIVAGSL